MRFARAPWFGAWFLFLMATAGCGSSASMAEVKGTVTVDGNPLENGAISFFPVDGKTKTAGGKIKDGQYRVEVPIGLMNVLINAPKFDHKEKLYDTPDSRERDVYVETLPPKYNLDSDLQVEVTAAGLEKDFELTTK